MEAAQLGGYRLGVGLIDDCNYVDTIRRGYLLKTATSVALKGEYVILQIIKSTYYAANTGKSVTVSASDLSLTYNLFLRYLVISTASVKVVVLAMNWQKLCRYFAIRCRR